jgi:hypothetical protein
MHIQTCTYLRTSVSFQWDSLMFWWDSCHPGIPTEPWGIISNTRPSGRQCISSLSSPVPPILWNGIFSWEDWIPWLNRWFPFEMAEIDNCWRGNIVTSLNWRAKDNRVFHSGATFSQSSVELPLKKRKCGLHGAWWWTILRYPYTTTFVTCEESSRPKEARVRLAVRRWINWKG